MMLIFGVEGGRCDTSVRSVGCPSRTSGITQKQTGTVQIESDQVVVRNLILRLIRGEVVGLRNR